MNTKLFFLLLLLSGGILSGCFHTQPDAWQTYNNSEYGFSFQYPSDFQIQETTGSSNFEKDFVAVDIGTPEYLESLENIPEETEGLPMYLQILAHEPFERPDLPEGCGEDPQPEFIIDEVAGVRCESLFLGEFPTLHIHLDRNNGIYYEIVTNKYSGKDKELIDRIIATLQFTDEISRLVAVPPLETLSPAVIKMPEIPENWETYTNSENNYEIKHSPDFRLIPAEDVGGIGFWPEKDSHDWWGYIRVVPKTIDETIESDLAIAINANSGWRRVLQKVEINGRIWTRLSEEQGAGENKYISTIHYLIEHNGKTYWLQFPPDGMEIMVATFRFHNNWASSRLIVDESGNPFSQVGESCIENSDCLVPLSYAIQSNCPFQAVCVDNQCAVGCSAGFSEMQSVACSNDTDCDCSSREGFTTECRCIENACVSVEMGLVKSFEEL